MSRNERWQFAGFQVAHIEQRIGGPSALPDTDTNVTIPHAAWVMVFSIPPALWLRRLRREWERARRIRAGLCAACGYDLRGGQSRCPECGTVAAAEDSDPQKLQFRPSRTATGKAELIATGECEWQEFPKRAQAVADRFRMTVTRKIDGLDERMWIAHIDESQFCISWDIWCPEVSVMAWENTPDAEIERLIAWA